MNDQLIQSWLDHLGSERGLASLTVQHYGRDLSRLASGYPNRPLTDLQHADIRNTMGRLHQQGLSGRSLARMLSAWRNFYQFLIQRHQHSLNPCDSLRPPRHPGNLPHNLTVDQAQHLLDRADRDSPLYLRDQAMFELLYSSGLRLSELAALKLAQLDLREQELRVIGKGNKTRIVPLGLPAVQALQAWMALLPPDSPYVFPGRQSSQHISPRTVQVRLALRARQSGLEEHVHPHMLRHAFASHLLQSSSDLRAVQELLGHAHIGSTQIYTRLDYQHLARVYDQAHPRARQKKR